MRLKYIDLYILMGGFTVEKVELNLVYFSGPTGPQGAQGASGEATGGTGPIGSQGARGLSGTPGTQGLPGIDLLGPRGPPGVDGISGDFGTFGAVGSQGVAGPQGAQGSVGPDSIIPAGPQGDEGPPGPQGAAGPGLTGPAGTMTGPPGAQGVDGEFVEQKKSTGMIFRQDNNDSLFETDSTPTYHLIQGRLAGTHDCNPFDISVWNQPLANNVNSGVFASDLPGEPAGFEIQTDCNGVYWFSYNLTFRNEGEVINREIVLECQVGPGPPILIVGSRSSLTVNDDIVHVSHSFLYDAVAGEQIGIYATNLSGASNICMDIDNSNFVSKLLEPSVIAV